MVYDLVKGTKLDLGQSIAGFEHLRFFQIDAIGPGSPFGMLQSEEDPGIGFVIVSPFEIYPDYEFRLTGEIVEGLKIEKPDNVAVYSIVTVKQPFTVSTINLAAPVVINILTGEGRQFIIDGTSYPIHAPLFPLRNGGE